MRNSFVLLVVDGEHGSVFWVAKVFLLLHLDVQADICGIEYVFLQNMKCTLVLDKVDKELGYACLKWTPIDEEGQNVVEEKELNNITKLNVGEWFRWEPLSAI